MEALQKENEALKQQLTAAHERIAHLEVHAQSS
jgi:hypothetical protein